MLNLLQILLTIPDNVFCTRFHAFLVLDYLLRSIARNARLSILPFDRPFHLAAMNVSHAVQGSQSYLLLSRACIPQSESPACYWAKRGFFLG